VILILGLIGGLAFGLSAFAGAFVSLPLLILGAGIGVHAALPVVLLSLGICSAIAAGDAVRARQCDTSVVVLYLVGALPAAIAAGVVVQWLPEDIVATVFLVFAIIFGPLLIGTARRRRTRLLPSPAALLHAPRRDWNAAAGRRQHSSVMRRRIVLASAGCGVIAAMCAAPGSWVAGRAINRAMPGQAFQVAGTLAFSLAALAILAAGLQFLLAPVAPGYASGMYVLGTVAGMGLSRRVEPMPIMRHSNTVIGVLVIALAMLMWMAVVATGSHAA